MVAGFAQRPQMKKSGQQTEYNQPIELTLNDGERLVLEIDGA
jgi:hypothetical protein